MNSKEIDLHIHSYYSDGTMSPKEILEEALNKKLKMVAIADHNVLEGSKELLSMEVINNIKCIPAVEIDTIDNDINYHILAYNFDIENYEFDQFVNKANNELDNISTRLIEKMEKDYYEISLKEYFEYSYPKEKGGWKALHYLREKGLTKELFEGYKFYGLYGPLYTTAKFPNIEETCKHIHNAGGTAIVAHPGRVLKNLNIEEFEQEMRRIIALGLDGIECYYPTHSKEIIEKCKELCNEYKLFSTAGSDCHGEFEDTIIGENNVENGNINASFLD